MNGLAFGVLVGSLLLGGCGSGVLGRARDTSGLAIRAHLDDARTLETSALVDLPPSAAWNGVVEAMRAQTPIAEANFGERRAQTHWDYPAPTVANGVATQRRVRHSVRLAGSDAGSYQVDVDAEAEQRRRETCAEAEAWSPAPAEPSPEVVRAAESALEELTSIDLGELSFPGTPEQVLPVVGDVLLRRWGLGPAPDGVRFPLRSGWRETEQAGEEVTVTVRSAVSVSARSRLQSEGEQVSGAGVQLDVESMLEWHGEQGEEGTAWIADDAGAVRADFFARLAERLPPQRVARAAVTPLEPRDPEPEVPDLPSPPDRLRGSYALHVRVVIAPPHPPSGGDWDDGLPILGALVRLAPHLYRLARLVFLDDVSVLRDYLPYLTGDEPTADRLARELGQRVSDMRAPDMYLGFALPTGSFGLELPDDTWQASGSEPLRITLNGDGWVNFVLVDRDLTGTQPMAQGSFSISELANACAPVCQHAAGAALCFEIQRLR